MSRMEVSVFSVLVSAVVLMGSMVSVDACNGYSLIIHKFSTVCKDGTPSIFTLSPDTNVTLTPDCKVIPKGCATMAEGFDSANVTYKVTPKMMPTLMGEKALCELLAMAQENPDATTYMGMFNMPTECPVTPGNICSDDKVVDISDKNVMMVPGIVEGEVEIKTNTGKKACLNFLVELKMG